MNEQATLDLDLPRPTTRRCLCGCGHLPPGMRSDAVWASRACAARWARANPGRSLLDARSPNAARTRPRSGLQVSLQKAAAAVADTFGCPTDVARAVLAGALSDRQRATLHAREAA